MYVFYFINCSLERNPAIQLSVVKTSPLLDAFKKQYEQIEYESLKKQSVTSGRVSVILNLLDVRSPSILLTPHFCHIVHHFAACIIHFILQHISHANFLKCTNRWERPVISWTMPAYSEHLPKTNIQRGLICHNKEAHGLHQVCCGGLVCHREVQNNNTAQIGKKTAQDDRYLTSVL